MPDLKIRDHHMIQFGRNVELLLQQKNSRLSGAVNTGSYQGENAQVVLQFGEVDMVPFSAGTGAGQWMGDTVWGDIEHFQRWVFPSDFSLALAISKPDPLRMLVDPRSPYAEAMRAAYARTVDDIIIAAATNDSKTGRFDDLRDTELPDEQIIDYDFKYEVRDSDNTGLSIGKLIKAKEMLIAANNDPGEARYLACSERQLSDLLRSIEVTNADYNSVRALVKGEVDTFMGFQFISTERLLKTGAAGAVPQIRHCLAWVKSALHFGTWNSLEFKADPRPDKNYAWQLWQSATMGATRTQEKKLVQINCAE